MELWSVQYPVNYVLGGDLTRQAFKKHIDEIALIYAHLNTLANASATGEAMQSIAINQGDPESVTLTGYTFKLDGSAPEIPYTQTLHGATTEAAGLMTANDKATLDANTQAIEAVTGKLRYLPAHDFGTATPEQADLTAYALGHTGLETVANSTAVTNHFDNHEWIYNEESQEWIDNGLGVVAQATNTTAGVGQFATDDEAAAGAAEDRIINPKQLNTGIMTAINAVYHRQDITESGAFVVPENVSLIYVSGCGGGGGGGKGIVKADGGHGGGGGGGAFCIIRKPLNVLSGQQIPVTIGGGGLGASDTVVGTAGGNTVIGNTTAYGGQRGASAESIREGRGGHGGAIGGTGGRGGTSPNGFSGQPGGLNGGLSGRAPDSGKQTGGGGGGGGNLISEIFFYGTDGYGGEGGSPNSSTNVMGRNATGYGCGGGGSGGVSVAPTENYNPGGNGRQGIAIFEWFTAS
ncbi:hypothetical protein FACS1894204_06150 [Synergistales bacterium]|nr:hypothetical protein FACS1894204_06150 [Synergistales bacterium]